LTAKSNPCISYS